MRRAGLAENIPDHARTPGTFAVPRMGTSARMRFTSAAVTGSITCGDMLSLVRLVRATTFPSQSRIPLIKCGNDQVSTVGVAAERAGELKRGHHDLVALRDRFRCCRRSIWGADLSAGVSPGQFDFPSCARNSNRPGPDAIRALPMCSPSIDMPMLLDFTRTSHMQISS